MSFIMRFISPSVYQQKPYTKSSFKDSIDFFIVFTIYDRNYRTKLLGKHLATGNLTIKAQQFFCQMQVWYELLCTESKIFMNYRNTIDQII